jgi:hypothetical protein
MTEIESFPADTVSKERATPLAAHKEHRDVLSTIRYVMCKATRPGMVVGITLASLSVCGAAYKITHRNDDVEKAS